VRSRTTGSPSFTRWFWPNRGSLRTRQHVRQLVHRWLWPPESQEGWFLSQLSIQGRVRIKAEVTCRRSAVPRYPLSLWGSGCHFWRISAVGEPCRCRGWVCLHWLAQRPWLPELLSLRFRLGCLRCLPRWHPIPGTPGYYCGQPKPRTSCTSCWEGSISWELRSSHLKTFPSGKGCGWLKAGREWQESVRTKKTVTIFCYFLVLNKFLPSQVDHWWDILKLLVEEASLNQLVVHLVAKFNDTLCMSVCEVSRVNFGKKRYYLLKVHN